MACIFLGFAVMLTIVLTQDHPRPSDSPPPELVIGILAAIGLIIGFIVISMLLAVFSISDIPM